MKRLRSDSVSATVRAAMNAAAPELRPPGHCSLSPEAEKFWPAIIHARARDEWRDVDLVVAAQLAECQALIESESIKLRAEGLVVMGGKNGDTPVENARNRVVQTLATREMALMRTLVMGGHNAVGDPRNQAGARKAEDAARRARADLEHESLLAS
jgi:hypothetical protein